MPKKYYKTIDERFQTMLGNDGRALMRVNDNFIVVDILKNPPEVLAGGVSLRLVLENYEYQLSTRKLRDPDTSFPKDYPKDYR